MKGSLFSSGREYSRNIHHHLILFKGKVTDTSVSSQDAAAPVCSCTATSSINIKFIDCSTTTSTSSKMAQLHHKTKLSTGKGSVYIKGIS